MAHGGTNNETVDVEVVETWSPENVHQAIHNLMPLFKEMIEGFQGAPKTRISMGPTGFDAKATRDQYFKKVNTRHVSPDDNPGQVDLIMFICLFLKYRNNVKKALRESKNPQTIKNKCLQYRIETGTKHRKLRPDQLTLSRIALAFPIHTAEMILKEKSVGVFEFSTFFDQKLPLVMQHTIFPGLIPTEKFTKELKEITYILNMEISVELFKRSKTNPKDFDDEESYLYDMYYVTENTEAVEVLVESSAKYVDAAIDNGIEDEKKLEVLTKAGILEVNAEGELELSAGTVALVNKLAGLKAVYSLPYNKAIQKCIFKNLGFTRV